jgi:hypothetical protein
VSSPTVSTVIRKQWPVITVTGHELELQSEKEQKYYVEARDKYLAENVFTAAADLRGLERLLLLEIQMFRYQWQLAAGVDYNLDFLTVQQESALQKAVKETSPMISVLQNDLGLTKAQRDVDTQDSVQGYLNNLKVAAKAFGVMREKQLGKAIELTKELYSIAGAYKRSNEAERKKLGFESAEDIIDYVLEVHKPQFDEVDAYFRANEQRYFIRKL